MKIKTFGPVDQRSLDQLKRCMEAGDAEFGVLCADHHPGYSQPIGGGIAYEGYVSPSGVGFDIGCIAAGSRVTTLDGYALPIESVTPAVPAACVDRGRVRGVQPNLGAVDRGRRAVSRLRLANGRELRLTDDHEVRTHSGWRAISQLDSGDVVLCTPFVAAPYEPHEVDRAFEIEGEACWVPVTAIESDGVESVWDVVTGDPAESFLAEGIVVHNCGNKAARTELTRADLDALGGVERVMGEITRRISFGVGVAATERVDHPVLEKIRKAEFQPQRKLIQLAQSQLGTVGGGNHFVNVFEDEEGLVWVGVHFGSRGFGHRTASGFLALAQGQPFDGRASEGEMDSPPVLFPVDSELGRSYVAAMNVALEYAYAGRDAVVAKVLEILGAEATHEVHNNHNYAAFEEHFGRRYWVVRKGCTPARPGQEGFVGGSMGDESVILEGAAGAEAEESLYSTVHGAGRVMSRTQAAGRIRRRKRIVDGRKVWVAEQIKPGVVDWPAVQARLRGQGIVLVGGGADEAPEVYKRLPEVLAAHAGSARVKHRLRPLGVAMAGADVYDPYKD